MVEKTLPPPTSTSKTAGQMDKDQGKDEVRDSFREICETVVFVVVLVLMLKAFVAEAFVIPTGSMAETLFGYHRLVTCDQCQHEFEVNCSSEADPQNGRIPTQVVGAICPNCHNPMRWDPYVQRPFADRFPALAVFAAIGAGVTYAGFYLHGKVKRDKVSKESAVYASVIAAVVFFKGSDMLLFGPPWNTGDRVLVAKFLYDRDKAWTPRRHDVVVFKFPEKPQQGSTAMNYIKRCEGLPGETIVIFDGDLYVTSSLTYSHRTPSEREVDRWKTENLYANDLSALHLFSESMKRSIAGKPHPDDFQIVRRSPEVMMAMRRIVYDADHPPADLADKGIFRWTGPEARWARNDPKAAAIFTHTPAGDSLEWITYGHRIGAEVRMMRPKIPAEMDKALMNMRHLLNVASYPESGDLRLITNMMGYNTGFGDGNWDPVGQYWVSDLMLDAEVKVEDAQGEFVMELSKGRDRFRAVFNIASGECTLLRLTGLTEAERAANTQVLAKESTALKGAGTHRVRFANFDGRLTVWVDNDLPFKDGVAYTPSSERSPTKENDLEAPARVGAQGAKLSVSHLQLWHDTYYTHSDSNMNVTSMNIQGEQRAVQSFYVQPGHYLCLGDNSASSADSRYWGLVPQRLLLGRALVIYFPFWPFEHRFGLIR